MHTKYQKGNSTVVALVIIVVVIIVGYFLIKSGSNQTNIYSNSTNTSGTSGQSTNTPSGTTGALTFDEQLNTVDQNLEASAADGSSIDSSLNDKQVVQPQ